MNEKKRMQRCREKKTPCWKKGSFTVEAACVMSLVLLVLFGMLYLSFFVHNRAWLTAAACEAALSGSMEGVKKEDKVYETANVRARELGSQGFFGAENLTAQVETGKKVRVSYAADTISGFGGFQWKLQVQGESKIIQPVKWIRRLKAAADLAAD